MINFLPPDAKSEVQREYLVRTVGVWAVLVSAVAIVTTVLLVPTYVLLTHQLDALALEVATADDESHAEAYTTARAALADTHTLALQLDMSRTGPTASEALHEVQRIQTDAIRVSGFSYAHTDDAEQTMEVRGIAATREALAGFAAALERNPLFARAEVPVSDLAADYDLPFTITITIADTH